MNLQIIKSIDGKDEYVLLPIGIYQALHNQIEERLASMIEKNDYVPFQPEDYVDNPVVLARIQAGITQKELAKHMKVSQAYISKLEQQESISAKTLNKVNRALAL